MVAVVASVQAHGCRQVAHRVSSEVLSAGPLAVVVVGVEFRERVVVFSRV